MHPRILIALSLATLAACAADPPSSAPPPAPARALADLPPDASAAVRDDRQFLQGMIDSTPDGGTLVIPPGDYVITRAGLTDYGLRVATPMRIVGYGATIYQAPATAPSVRLIHVDADDVTLEGMTFDGAASEQLDGDEHRAGPFVTRRRCRLIRITAQHFTGDGVYLYGTTAGPANASGAVLEDVRLLENGRNGVTIGGQTDGLAIRGGTFARNLAQQIDSEAGAPATVNDVTITDATIDPGPSEQYAITVSGTGSASRSARWRIVGNTITRGGIFIVWADDVVVAGNDITSATAKPCVYVYRTANRITVAHNRCALTSPTASFPSGIAVIGTGTGQEADAVTIADNEVTAASPTALGIRVQGAIAATVVANVLHGSGVANLGGSAVYIRPTDQATPMKSAVVVGNVGVGFGKRGLSVAGNVTARLLQLTAVGNAFGDSRAVQDVGMYLDDGTHPIVRSTLADTHYGSGVTSGRFGEALP